MNTPRVLVVLLLVVARLAAASRPSMRRAVASAPALSAARIRLCSMALRCSFIRLAISFFIAERAP